jgi:predicted nucleic-acid-binding protein
MTGLDTNVIVRFLMKDDAEQAALANTVFAEIHLGSTWVHLP